MGKNKAMNRLMVLVLAALLFAAVNIVSTNVLTSARLDLTADRLYSLSDGTGKILSDLQEPLTIKFFFSDNVATPYPTVKSYGRRVRDLLETYASLSGGKLDLKVIDPEPFSTAEDDAVAAGLKAVQTPTGDTLYFGVVGSNSTDGQIAIPYLSPDREEFLEYDLTKLVSDLATPKRPVVGLISSLPLEYGPGGPMAAAQGQSAPYAIYVQLRQSYDVRSMGQVFSTVDPDVDLLVIAHPGELGEAELYAIDQFVLRGGRVVAFVDPNLEAAAYMGESPMGAVAASSTLGKLFDAWGIAYDDGKIVADRGLAQRVAMVSQSGGRVYKDYVAWIALHRPNVAADDVVTAQLDDINLASAGALSANENATTRFEPMMMSSEDSMLIDASQVRYSPDPDDLLVKFKSEGKRFAIAARVTGPAMSAFSAPVADEGTNAAPYIASAKDINVVVVADADMLEDRFWVSQQNFLGQQIAVPIADNGAFVVNAVDNMVGSSALISLRSRGVSQRPFTVVDDIRRRAEAEFLAEEQRLEAKLQETEKRLRGLEQGSGGDKAALDKTQADEVETFRQEMLATRRQLRDVQHSLRKDIERLGATVKFVNIAGMPILITVVALVVAFMRRRRRAKAQLKI